MKTPQEGTLSSIPPTGPGSFSWVFPRKNEPGAVLELSRARGETAQDVRGRAILTFAPQRYEEDPSCPIAPRLRCREQIHAGDEIASLGVATLVLERAR